MNKSVASKIAKPKRATISKKYEALLMKCPPEVRREALSHEWDWGKYADAIELIAGY